MRMLTCAFALAMAAAAMAGDLDTSFTYQGQLKDSGSAYPNNVDLRFTLYGLESGGTAVAGPVTISNKALDNGVFTVELDFGEDAFNGNNRWLQIDVAAPAGSGFAPLDPRQQVTATPYALERSIIHIDETQERVGINTNNPAVDLHTVGVARVAHESLPTQFLQTTSTDVGNFVIGICDAATKRPLILESLFQPTGPESGETSISFRTGPVDSPVESMLIKEDGRIGIGNTTPGTTVLHVGTGDGTILKLGQAPELIFKKDTANDKFSISVGGNNYGGNDLQIGRDDGSHNTNITGRVGIGTTAPGAPLEVVEPSGGGSTVILRGGSEDVNPNINFMEFGGEYANIRLNEDNANALEFQQSGTTRMTLTPGGDLGVGTTSPQARLHVNGLARFDNDVSVTNGASRQVLIENNAIRMDDSNGIRVFNMYSNANGGGSEAFWANGAGQTTIEIDADESDSAALRLFNAAGTNTVQLLANDSGDGGIRLYNAAGTETIRMDGGKSSSAVLSLYNSAGVRTIELDSDVGGDGRVITQELQITGGSDLSEQFDVNACSTTAVAPEPGMVVVIDPADPGNLAVASRAYDPTVAGVISGAGGVKPGMLMGQHGTKADGELPVALTGRVYVKATASNGAIRPGDLLTTSGIPGHAMKAGDRNRSHGATLGKAMSTLEEGTGLVLVLVNLQ